MTEDLLPQPFSDLSRFVHKWDKPGTEARYAERLSSSMAELQEFHDAMLPRGQAIKAYLDGRPFDDYTEPDRRLGRLMFAFAKAAMAVEIFKQPRVPDAAKYWKVPVEPDL
ncbi:MAG TPA: hypothetical protein VKS60_25745 [Stellaceae bacterium]|nr:hypothetical protein [Stellaceae bacterium]